MMEAQDVVLGLLHKNITDEIIVKVKSGPKGYGLLLKLRLLLYAMLIEIFSTRKLLNHLKKRPLILDNLGFQTLPNKNRKTICSPRTDYDETLFYVFVDVKSG